MDKKVTYYIIAGVVLVATIGIIIAMQGQKNGPTVIPGGEMPKTEPVKSEMEAVQEIGKTVGGIGLPLRITLEDNGQTVSLTPGKNIVMMLGTDYNWTITSSDDKVMAKKDIALTDARMQAVYQAVGAGEAVMNATGTCKAGGCAMPSATFSINVKAVATGSQSAEDLMK
jgi:hypothetical protein